MTSDRSPFSNPNPNANVKELEDNLKKSQKQCLAAEDEADRLAESLEASQVALQDTEDAALMAQTFQDEDNESVASGPFSAAARSPGRRGSRSSSRSRVVPPPASAGTVGRYTENRPTMDGRSPGPGAARNSARGGTEGGGMSYYEQRLSSMGSTGRKFTLTLIVMLSSSGTSLCEYVPL